MQIDTSHSALSDALVILGAAGLVIPAFARLRISPVIGFILVGMAVGPSGLGSMVKEYPWLFHLTITDPLAIAPFAEFGIILLLFSIGLELSFGRLWRMRKAVFGLGSLELFGSAAIIALGLIVLGNSWAAATGLGLALALSSTALVLPIAGTTSQVGKTAFSMLLFEDLALVPIIFFLGAISPSQQGDGLGGILTVALQGGVTVVALLIAGRYVLPHIFSQAARTKSPEVFLAASLLVVIVSSLATALAGLSPIVGALLAGLLIAETDYHNEVEMMTAPFKGLALGVFLITVGMSVDLRFIAENWGSLILAVFAVIMVKTLVTAFLLRLTGARRGLAAEVGLLMASPSETTLIVLSASVTAGLIAGSAAAFWQIATAIGLTITPLLARIGHDLARRIESGSSEIADTEFLADQADRAVVIGFGRIGRIVCELLRMHDIPFIVVESDPDIALEGRRLGFPVIYGDVSRAGMLDKLRLGHARALILTMDDPVMTVATTKRVRGWVPKLPIIARARDVTHASDLYMAGVTEAVPEALESSLQLAETALVELGTAMGPVIATIHQRRDELRQEIKQAAKLGFEPRLRTRIRDRAIGVETDSGPNAGAAST